MAAGTPWVLRGAPRVLSGNSEIFQNLDELDKHSQIMSNYVELCRTLSNCRISSNSSNFVELCRTCRTLLNYVELCQFGRILKIFVKFSLFFLSLSDCQTSQNFVEFFKSYSSIDYDFGGS